MNLIKKLLKNIIYRTELITLSSSDWNSKTTKHTVLFNTYYFSIKNKKLVVTKPNFRKFK